MPGALYVGMNNVERTLGNWGEPIRATGDDAVKIALVESSAEEPLWLCRFGEPDAWSCCVCIPVELAPSMPVGHTRDLYLPIGRVGWCVIGSVRAMNGSTTDRIVDGPFQHKDEAYCKLAMYNGARAKSGYAQSQVRFYVTIRHTPESFWQMVRRMDSERRAAKAARS